MRANWRQVVRSLVCSVHFQVVGDPIAQLHGRLQMSGVCPVTEIRESIENTGLPRDQSETSSRRPRGLKARSSIRIPSKSILIRIAVWCLLVCGYLSSAFAFGHDRTIAQYVHTAWSQKEGAPSGILALAQTTDGFLWVGTVDALYRFDGVSFELRRRGIVYALLARPNGDLWIGRKSAISLLRNNQTKDYTVSDGVPDGKIASFAEDGEGTMWAATNAGLARLEGDRWRQVGGDWNFHEAYATGMLLDRQGTFWVAAGHTILYLPPGSHRFQTTEIATTQVWTLVEAPNGKLWMSETSRSVRPIPLGRDLPPSDKTEFVVGSIGILFDREGSLWISTLGSGLRCVPSPERIDGRKFKEDDHAMESFMAADGLTDNLVTAILEDREGNIWVGTNNGLDRFYKSALVPLILPFPLVQPVMGHGDAGSLWVSALYHNFQVQASGSITIRPAPNNYFGAYRAPDGALWWSGSGFVDRLEPGAADWSRPHRIRVPLDPARKIEQWMKIAEDRNGVIWAASETAGIFYLRNNQWHPIAGVAIPVGYTGNVAFTDWAGRVWLGFQDGTLVLIEDGKIKRSWSGRDSPVGHVVGSVAGRGRHVWLGGDKLVYFDGENFHDAVPADGTPFKVCGIEEARDGGLWLCENRGVIHISSAEVDRFLRNYSYRVQYDLYNSLDGLPGSFADAASRSREIQGTDGRIWFSSTKGIAWLNPAAISKNTVPPPVSIRSVKVDGKEYPMADVTFPPLTTALEIDYTALSLSIPERVQFRYKLEGVDKNWENAGTRREAFYTSLSPGQYTFHVVACNNDGVWNERGATLKFVIDPAWYQASWFMAFCALLSLLVAWMIYRLRVRQIATALSARFDERLAERTRLARELHDTFLQTVQGSKMIADDALDADADQNRMRQALEKLSRWLGQAVDEGRAALHSLRVTTTEKNHLSEALRRATEDHQLPSSMTVTFSVIGDPKDLHPIVRDEVYRIGYEAIRNAAAHSRASRLEIDLRYANDLSLRIKDNGLGIDPSIPELGREGHFGLQGMRERASRIHSKLAIVSSANAGTEVSLVVPGAVVYRNEHPSPLESLKEGIRRFFRSSRSDGI